MNAIGSFDGFERSSQESLLPPSKGSNHVKLVYVAFVWCSALTGVILASVNDWPGNSDSTCYAAFLPYFIVFTSFILFLTGVYTLANFAGIKMVLKQRSVQIFAFFSFLGIVWASFGAFWTSHSEDCLSTYGTLYFSSVFFSTVLILVSFSAMTWGMLRNVQFVKPDDHGVWILSAVRCSCIPNWSLKAVLVGCFASIAGCSIYVLVIDLENTCHHMRFFVVGSAAVFVTMAAVSIEIAFGKRKHDGFVVSLLLGTGGCGVAWAIVASVQIFSHGEECSDAHPHLYAMALALKTTLFVVCSTVLALTCCCRTERMLVDLSEGERFDVRRRTSSVTRCAA